MKLGTQTGSLTNHIYSRAVIGQPNPEIGMGATVLCWTDRHAATITAILNSSATIIVVRLTMGFLLARTEFRTVQSHLLSSVSRFSFKPRQRLQAILLCRPQVFQLQSQVP